MNASHPPIKKLKLWINKRVRESSSIGYVFTAIANNDVASIENYLLTGNPSDLKLFFIYAVMCDSEKIVEYILCHYENEVKVSNYFNKLFEITSLEGTYRCLPRLLVHEFMPENNVQKIIVNTGMKKITPQPQVIERMSKIIICLSAIVMFVEGVIGGIISTETAEEQIRLVTKKIKTDFFQNHFGAYYMNLINSESFGKHEYQELKQITFSLTVFNWLVGAEAFSNLFSVDTNIVEKIAIFNEYFKHVESGSEVQISNWGEVIHALKTIIQLLNILESNDSDNLNEKIVEFNAKHMHMDEASLTEFIKNDKGNSINVLKERARALKWLSGYDKRYICC